jgi:hypothetical protein
MDVGPKRATRLSVRRQPVNRTGHELLPSSAGSRSLVARPPALGEPATSSDASSGGTKEFADSFASWSIRSGYHRPVRTSESQTPLVRLSSAGRSIIGSPSLGTGCSRFRWTPPRPASVFSQPPKRRRQIGRRRVGPPRASSREAPRRPSTRRTARSLQPRELYGSIKMSSKPVVALLPLTVVPTSVKALPKP